MARALYEEMAKDNHFYKANPRPEPFCSKMTPSLLEEARATLAVMLEMDFPESTKHEISEALILDNEFRPARAKHSHALAKVLTRAKRRSFH